MEPQVPQTPNTAPQVPGPENGPAVLDATSAPEVMQGPAPQETVAQSAEAVNQNPAMVLPVVQQTPVVAPAPVSDTATNAPTVTVSGAPSIADDVDLIETEWVNKAKKIVNETRDDPRQQNREVSALKADYMKKRYGKDIKLSDD